MTELDWQKWVDRWDRMQERYLVARSERFDVITRLLADTQDDLHSIVDLGCGTGSLAALLLERFPNAEVYGLDVDPTMLLLARSRTEVFAGRAHFVQTDLRGEAWLSSVPASVDAVVSATALHWLSEPQMEALYSQMAQVIRPGGIFLNADHVGSESPLVQDSWERHRNSTLQTQSADGADDWGSFWSAYLDELGAEARQERESALGKWTGVETGLPLTWHLDQLRACGFDPVDCFWRCDCDAIYGGLRAR